MISLLQKVLQKHHKWLFSILLAVVTISFVFTVGSSPGIGRNMQRQEKKIFGYELSSPKSVSQLMKEVELNAQLQQIFIGTEALQNYALFSRLAILKLANDFGIPKSNKKSLNRFIENYPIFQDDNKKFDANKYNDFLERMKKDSTQLGVFERTIANDSKIATMEKLLLGQGYALDSQAKSEIVRGKTEYSFLTAKFDASLLTNEPQYAEDELQQYFDMHQDAYQIGEQIVLNYIEFPLESFAEKIPEPSLSDLQQIYRAHKNQFQNLLEGSKELETALIETYQHNMIDRLAMEAATQFAYDLYEKNIIHGSEQFKQLIEERKLKVSPLDPVTLGQFSENEHFSDESLAQASKLNGDRYFSDPVWAKNGNPCLLLYQDLIPSIYPPLDIVREQVIRDFMVWKKEEIFSQQIDEIQKTLAEIDHLSPEVFAKIVTNKRGTFAKLDRKTLNEGIAPQEQEVLLSLRVGTTSKAIFTKKMEAEIIFLTKREIPSNIDSANLEQMVTILEKKNKEGFNDYILEMILDEIGVTERREETMQHFQMMASLIYMQRHRNEFKF
ncbi:MAG: SurA N-terminal domain-containing protein [Puniceicoccales bacterium]|jgi:peptidyl-prolyl cis-trans isomerase D|nr:SurA N-terminal domain-containing protein [Puniceicoccales bacterium]